MANGGAGAGVDDMSELLGVLAQGEERSRLLEGRLGQSASRSLARQLQAAFKKATSLAQSMDQPPAAGAAAGGGSGRRGPDKKRSSGAPKWTVRMQVAAAAADGPPEDGYSWRKYGQKDILNAKHPRGYYRCTHQKLQGCPARKHVQRCEDDPLAFDVTYEGDHTCNQTPREPPPPPASWNSDVDGGGESHQLLLSFDRGLKIGGGVHGTVVPASSFPTGAGGDVGNYYAAPPTSYYAGGATPQYDYNYDYEYGYGGYGGAAAFPPASGGGYDHEEYGCGYGHSYGYDSYKYN